VAAAWEAGEHSSNVTLASFGHATRRHHGMLVAGQNLQLLLSCSAVQQQAWAVHAGLHVHAWDTVFWAHDSRTELTWTSHINNGCCLRGWLASKPAANCIPAAGYGWCGKPATQASLLSAFDHDHDHGMLWVLTSVHGDFIAVGLRI